MRAFLPTPVARATVEELLTLASRSPSGSNIQPWKVHVVAGEKRRASSRAPSSTRSTATARRSTSASGTTTRSTGASPTSRAAARSAGTSTGCSGIRKGDFESTEQQRRRNYEFFGAPVGLIFTLDEDLEIGSWLDLGIFIGSLTIAARGRGLDTCPQAAFADFHAVIRRELSIPESEIIICGMALGHADPDAVENRLVTERAPRGPVRHLQRILKTGPSMHLPDKMLLVDVAPRDGLQSLPKWIDTDTKVWLCDRLTDLGVPVVEVASFAHPKVVPNMRTPRTSSRASSASPAWSTAARRRTCAARIARSRRRWARCSASSR